MPETRTLKQVYIINVCLKRILDLVNHSTSDSNPQIFDKIDMALTVARTKLKGSEYENAADIYRNDLTNGMQLGTVPEGKS